MATRSGQDLACEAGMPRWHVSPSRPDGCAEVPPAAGLPSKWVGDVREAPEVGPERPLLSAGGSREPEVTPYRFGYLCAGLRARTAQQNAATACWSGALGINHAPPWRLPRAVAGHATSRHRPTVPRDGRPPNRRPS